MIKKNIIISQTLHSLTQSHTDISVHFVSFQIMLFCPAAPGVTNFASLESLPVVCQ